MHDLVKDYYGRQLASSADLKTSACCDPSQLPTWLKPPLARIHPGPAVALLRLRPGVPAAA